MHDLYFHCWLPCHPQSTNSPPTVNCWPTVSQLLADTLGDTVGSNSIPCPFLWSQQIPMPVLTDSPYHSCSQSLFDCSHLHPQFSFGNIHSHRCELKKKIISMMNSMCLPKIIFVGGCTGQHVGTSLLAMSIGLYLLYISKQMLTMSCHSSSQSLLNCCHTHPQSLFGYSHSCAGEKNCNNNMIGNYWCWFWLENLSKAFAHISAIFKVPIFCVQFVSRLTMWRIVSKLIWVTGQNEKPILSTK